MAKQQASRAAKGGTSATGASGSNSRESQAQLKAGAMGGQGISEVEVPDTGEYDETYNLVSVLYHALQGAETYGKYIKDAERAGDNELVEFFEEVRDEEVDRAARAKHLLLDRLVDEDELEEADDSAGEEEE